MNNNINNNNNNLNREIFNTLMIESIYNIENFNSEIKKLGVTVKSYIGYEYYIGDNFICSTEDLCVDDIIEAAGYKVEDLHLQ